MQMRISAATGMPLASFDGLVFPRTATAFLSEGFFQIIEKFLRKEMRINKQSVFQLFSAIIFGVISSSRNSLEICTSKFLTDKSIWMFLSVFCFYKNK